MVVFQAIAFSDDEEDNNNNNNSLLHCRPISLQLAARLGPKNDPFLSSPHHRPGFQPLRRPKATRVTPNKPPILLRIGATPAGRARGYRVPESDDSDSSDNDEPNDTFLHRVAPFRRHNPPPKQRQREEKTTAWTPKRNVTFPLTPAPTERARTPKSQDRTDIGASPSLLLESSVQSNTAKMPRKNASDSMRSPSKQSTTAVRATALDDIWDIRGLVMKKVAWMAAQKRTEELERVRESASEQALAQLRQLKLKEDQEISVRIQKIDLLSSEREKEIARKDAEALSRNASMKKRHEALFAELRNAEEKKARELAAVRQKEEARIALEASQRIAKENAEKEAIEKANQAAVAESAYRELQQKQLEAKAQEERENKSKQEEREYVSPTALAEAEVYREKLRHLKENVLPSSKRDKPMKDYCFSTKREITKRISQLVNQRREIMRICTELDAIFKDAQSKGVIVYEWLLNLAAKSVVSQAEKEVAVRTPAAFPLARVCVYLMQQHPEFKLILLARMIKRCPYIVPQYATKQSDADAFIKAKGYKKNADGKVEQEGAFIERQCGIVSLYAAITQTIPSDGQHPLGLECAWRWIARFVNMKPRESFSPALLLSFLEMTAPRLSQAYGTQFVKLLVTINAKYVKLCPEASAAHVSRLTSKLAQFAREGRWEEIQGTQYE